MAFEGSREKVGIVGEVWAFLRLRKKWWLSPIIVTLALLGLFVVLTANSALAPLIYSMW